ncbi:YheC/YheD family protein [Bacillus mangrovi]|uniref:YheC/YheD family protein n=1 Tax=Metabacillus mangrovi TaxID=1491830 RepID=A0A7X2V5W4_9BACI|nr:YheC/YheD family protein [Metabacillus mangrovi]MTH54616.1 YheC/YheD family protein [Metabacillus mangrovi]
MNETVGFMTLREDAENLYSTEIARRAGKYGLALFKFSPASIQPGSTLISGRVFEKEEWKKAMRPLPSFIYDRCFYSRSSHTSKARPIADWLKTRPDTVFLGKGLPDKWAVYQAIKQDPTLSFYLPSTLLLASAKEIFPLLFRERQCMLKPVRGSQGRGIIALSLSGKTIEAVYHSGVHKKTKVFPAIEEFEEWMDQFLEQSRDAYLMQPLLTLTDRARYPFDIRILLQKDGDGKWQERGRGIRKGYQGSYISNLGSGGEGQSYDDWFSRLSRRQAYLFQDDLSTVIAKLPVILEEQFSPLFELGLDIGYSRDGSIWILDINSKPGRQLIMQTKPELKDALFEAPLAYCRHLIRQQEAAALKQQDQIQD